MKNVIVGTLAVIGGITVGLATVAGVVGAIQVAKERRRYNNMTPEEREAELEYRRAMVAAAVRAMYESMNGEATEGNDVVPDDVNETAATV